MDEWFIPTVMTLYTDAGLSEFWREGWFASRVRTESTVAWMLSPVR